jgi:predicted Zn-dependent protease
VFPFADPEAMLEWMFGEGGKEDESALAKIKVSPAEERKLGESVLQAFIAELKRQGIEVTDRGREVKRLKALVEKVQPLMTNASRYRTIDVYVARSAQCEAKSAPGGALVFFEGMLEACTSDAALATVVGHELSHLDRGHLLKRAKQWKLAQEQFAAPGKARRADDFFRAGATLMRIFTRPFRPEDEAEADADAVRWAYQLGYDPRELTKVFDAMAHQKDARQFLPGFLQSHPDLKSRKEAVLRLYEELRRGDPKKRLKRE